MEDTLEDVISLNLLMSDDLYDSFICIYIERRGGKNILIGCVVCVLELKPSKT